MKETNITTLILSISTPGTYLQPFNDALTKEITRATNIELSRICATHPDPFRFFDPLPLLSAEDSIAEIIMLLTPSVPSDSVFSRTLMASTWETKHLIPFSK
jgi:hypothetical protein